MHYLLAFTNVYSVRHEIVDHLHYIQRPVPRTGRDIWENKTWVGRISRVG